MDWTPEDARRIAYIRLSNHAAERMIDMRCTPDMIFEAIARPDQVWEQRKKNRFNKFFTECVFRRGDVMVVVDKDSNIVVTVLLRTEHRFVRGEHNVDNMPIGGRRKIQTLTKIDGEKKVL